MKKYILIGATVIFLAACGNNNAVKNEVNLETKETVSETTEAVTTESQTTEVPTTEKLTTEEKQAVKDSDISIIDGIAHLNLPRVDTYEYGQVLLSNSFNIKGYHAGDAAGDLIAQLGPAKKVYEQEDIKSYEYDNFTVGIKGSNIYGYSLNIEDQHIADGLEEAWQNQSENTYSEYMRFDRDKTNGYYIEVYPDMDKGLYTSIAIIGENNKQRIAEDRQPSGSHYNFVSSDGRVDVTSPAFHDYFFFGNHTNDFADIKAGMTIGDIADIYGQPTEDGQDGHQGGYYKFGDIAVSMINPTDKIAINPSQKISKDQVLELYGEPTEQSNEAPMGDMFIYNTNPTNGYQIRIMFDGNGYVSAMLNEPE